MVKRKVKRYNGETDSDVSSFAGTPENESNAGMKEAADADRSFATEKEPGWESSTSTPAKQTFKEAFAAAKKGDTFTWEGKKYLKEYAGEKKAAPTKVAPTAALKDDQYNPDVKQRSAARVGRAGQASSASPRVAEPTSEGMAAANAKRARQREEMSDIPIVRAFKALRARGESGSSSYAKGGMTASKRADGIAQRGKTRGTMVACGGGYMKGKK